MRLSDVVALWHPVALAISYVFISFTATPLPGSALMRPLLIAVVATVVLQGVLWLVLRRPYLAALITSGVVLVSSAAWLALGIIAAGLVWWLLVSRMRKARGARPLRFGLASMVRLFGGVFWFMALVAAVPVVGILLDDGGSTRTEPGEASPDATDILVVLLDGYPRADALERMGGDNSAFLAELEDRGFVTATDSRANYTSTWATLSSMLHGRYLDDIPDLERPYPDDAAAQYRALMRLIREAPLLDQFRADGYEIVTLPPAFEGAQLTAADRVISAPQMTAFELSLIQRSPLGYLALRIEPLLAYGQHRERTETTLRLTAEELARESARPRLVFSHVVSPHAPMVADAEGRSVRPPDCFPDCSMYQFGSLADFDRLGGQVDHLNDLVLELVDSVLAAQPDATIVLMSDHGIRRPENPEADLLRNLFSMRSADGETAVPDDIQPTAILRLLAGDAVEALPYRAWISVDNRPLDMSPYEGPLP